VFCNQCGQRIGDGSVFCNLCGAKQGVTVPAAAPVPGVPQPPFGGPGATSGFAPPAPPTMSTAAPAARSPIPQDLKCNSCGAPMKPQSGMSLLVCEYCGAVTAYGAAGATMVQNHFMLDNRLSQEAALEAGGKWLNKGLLRRKVAERSDLGQVVLRYVPYWIVPTSVIADIQGTRGSAVGGGTAGKAAGIAMLALTVAAASQNRNVRGVAAAPQVVRVRDRIQLQFNIPVVAVRGYTRFQPDDGFQFDVQSKMAFDKRASGGVEVMSGDVNEAEAKQQASALAHKFAGKEAKKRVDTLESLQVYPTTYDGELLHAPVWFMEYEHKGKKMYILIDGHAGKVMDGERPALSLF